jgi:hypothetical protein
MAMMMQYIIRIRGRLRRTFALEGGIHHRGAQRTNDEMTKATTTKIN